MVEEEGNNDLRARLPSLPGTYALVLSAAACQKVAVGRLGTLTAEPGFYLYVGSALGPGGLAARVGRHCRREKTLRWHVDYLRTVTRIVEVWYATGKSHRECRWAAALGRMPRASVPLVGFGASDCRCPSHLLFFSTRPSFSSFRQNLRSRAIQRLPAAGRTVTTLLLILLDAAGLMELGGKLLAGPLAEGLLNGFAGVST